jgi:hypothetical protein
MHVVAPLMDASRLAFKKMLLAGLPVASVIHYNFLPTALQKAFS